MISFDDRGALTSDEQTLGTGDIEVMAERSPIDASNERTLFTLKPVAALKKNLPAIRYRLLVLCQPFPSSIETVESC